MCEVGDTGVEEQREGLSTAHIVRTSTALQVLNYQQQIILFQFLLLPDFFKAHFSVFPLIIYVILEVKMHEAQS